MIAGRGMAYAQARIQSRFGMRADDAVWVKLQNIHGLGSYLQTAQQTPLRHWVLGISATHSSHEIELTLRQKFRHHIDEVANWVPGSWRNSLTWLKRLPDLPALQYLATGGEPHDWMKRDPDLADFTGEDHHLRLLAMKDAGCSSLVKSLSKDGEMFEGWIEEWNRRRPKSVSRNDGFRDLERSMQQQLRSRSGAQDESSPLDYDAGLNQFRRIFRRYAFRPAGVCAYLAIVMIDLHRVRSDLLQRRFFPDTALRAEDLLV